MGIGSEGRGRGRGLVVKGGGGESKEGGRVVPLQYVPTIFQDK